MPGTVKPVTEGVGGLFYWSQREKKSNRERNQAEKDKQNTNFYIKSTTAISKIKRQNRNWENIYNNWQ